MDLVRENDRQASRGQYRVPAPHRNAHLSLLHKEQFQLGMQVRGKMKTRGGDRLELLGAVLKKRALHGFAPFPGVLRGGFIV